MEEQKKYGVIYADPPWQYKVYSKKGMGRSAESHYPTMNIEDIKALLPYADKGIEGVIVGKSIYTGSLDLQEAIKVAREA